MTTHAACSSLAPRARAASLRRRIELRTASAEAIFVSVHLPDDSKQGSVLRLDSGSNVARLIVDHQARTCARVQGSTISKQAKFVYACTPERNVKVGTKKECRSPSLLRRKWWSLFECCGDGVPPTTCSSASLSAPRPALRWWKSGAL